MGLKLTFIVSPINRATLINIIELVHFAVGTDCNFMRFFNIHLFYEYNFFNLS